jgi:hypothetical protein
MTLKNLGAHKNEIRLNDQYDTRVLVSYETPVAYRQLLADGVKFFQTEKKWSRTTSKHITQWLNDNEGDGSAMVVPQSSLDLLFNTLDKPMTEVK